MKTAILAMLLLAGCATTQKYTDAMNHLVGMDKEAFVKTVGIPDEVLHDGDFDVYVYDRYNEVSPLTGVAFCRTEFFFKNDHVDSYRLSGSGCVAQ